MYKNISKLLLMVTTLTFLMVSCSKEKDNLTTDANSSVSKLKATSSIIRTNPAIVKDASGNAIVVWSDNRSGSNNVYAQKLDPSGKRLWAATDIHVNSSAGGGRPALAVDGSGNAIITWVDGRNIVNQNNNADIYAQKLDPTGKKLWAAADVRVNSDNGIADQEAPHIGVDGSGNVVIEWMQQSFDNTNYYVSDVYAQKLNASGKKQWAADIHVNAVAGSTLSVSDCSIAVNGTGNSVITWIQSGYPGIGVRAQRLDPNGKKQWTEVRVDDNSFPSANAALSHVGVDNSGNAIISYEGDYESLVGPYVQKLNANGVKLWAQNKSVSAVGMTADNAYHNMAVDGSGNIVVVWQDFRVNNYYLYIQKLDPNGNRLWGANDIQFKGSAATQPTVTIDGSGNSIFAWVNGSIILAQKLNASAKQLWAADVQVNY